DPRPARWNAARIATLVEARDARGTRARRVRECVDRRVQQVEVVGAGHAARGEQWMHLAREPRTRATPEVEVVDRQRDRGDATRACRRGELSRERALAAALQSRQAQ